MPSDREYRELSFKMGQASLKRPDGKKARIRESLDTLVLGSLSTSVGVVVMLGLISGMIGRPVEGWNQAQIASVGKYLVPTLDWGIAAIVGEVLGVAGMLVGYIRRGAISPLSVLGTIICLSQMHLFFVYIFSRP